MLGATHCSEHVLLLQLQDEVQDAARLRQQVQSLEQQVRDLQVQLEKHKDMSAWEDDRRKIVTKYNDLLDRYQASEKV